MIKRLGLLLFLLLPVLAQDLFHVYAPARKAGELLIIEAKVEIDDLTLKMLSRLPLGFPAATITSHPAKPILYIAPAATATPTTTGAILHLGKDGLPSEILPQAFKHGCCYLSLDRKQKLLFGVNYGDAQVDIYKLDADHRSFERVAGFDEGRKAAHCILPCPDNRFFYIPHVKENNALYQYRFDENSGAITPLDPLDAKPPAGTGPRHMAYHPTLPIVYTCNEQQVGASVYDRLPNGQLKFRQLCEAVDKDRDKKGLSASDIQITPDGRFVFAGLRGHRQNYSHITRYKVLADGGLELLGLTKADASPWGLSFSPKARYLCVTAAVGGTLTLYKIGEDGDLKQAAALDLGTKVTDLVTR